jgi:hypothetical protein
MIAQTGSERRYGIGVGKLKRDDGQCGNDGRHDGPREDSVAAVARREIEGDKADGELRQEFQQPQLADDDGRRMGRGTELLGDLARIGIDAGRLAGCMWGGGAARLRIGDLLAQGFHVELSALFQLVHGISSLVDVSGITESP